MRRALPAARVPPLGASTIRQIHFILSGALKRAVRWRWVATNPIAQAEPPAAPKPNPQPPTAAEAARILTAAWAADPDWGTLVWLAMVTGDRGAASCARCAGRTSTCDRRVLAAGRSIGQRSAARGRRTPRPTSSGGSPSTRRRSTCWPSTGSAGSERAVGARRRAARPTRSCSRLPRTARRTCVPNSVSAALRPTSPTRLGIDTTLHKLRHYSATELIAAGVDVRTVAGRLGHGGGGTTTLRVYAAWVSESDQRAAGSAGARMPARPTEPPMRQHRASARPNPYEALAALLRQQIESGELADDSFLPSVKALAATHRVAVGTAHRAVASLVAAGYAEIVVGRGTRASRSYVHDRAEVHDV